MHRPPILALSLFASLALFPLPSPAQPSPQVSPEDDVAPSDAVPPPGRALPAPPPQRGLPPLPPRDLLRLLPPPPEGYSLSRSRASLTHDGWLLSSATRIYQLDLPADAPGSPETTPTKVTLTLADTARHPRHTTAFANFEPRDAPHFLAFLHRSSPAITTSYPGAPTRTRSLVAGRFLITLLIEGTSAEDAAGWLDRLPLARLAQIPDGQPITLPATITAIHVDQLDPSRNSSHTLAISSPAHADAVASQLDPDPEPCFPPDAPESSAE
jgi:hypothetical protein